jgi:polyhydroxyalkanoate synthase subunit PhaC
MTTAQTSAIELAGALDLVLASPATRTVTRFVPGKAGVRMASSLAKRPQLLTTRGRQLGTELAKVATGASALAPTPQDRRFADPAWKDNALMRRLLQAYLAAARTAETLVEDAQLDWRDAERMRFLVTNLIEAASPSNSRSPARRHGRL